MKLQIATDYARQTYNPTNYGEYGYSAIRMPGSNTD
jgi:hypothetical protein